MSGKLLKISEERSIYIIENVDGSYIDNESIIHYRNIGKTFEIAQINTSFTQNDGQSIYILDEAGNSKFHFPIIWLDTNMMKLIELQEQGLIQFK